MRSAPKLRDPSTLTEPIDTLLRASRKLGGNAREDGDISLYSGLSGVAWALSRIAHLRGDGQLLQYAEQVMPRRHPIALETEPPSQLSTDRRGSLLHSDIGATFLRALTTAPNPDCQDVARFVASAAQVLDGNLAAESRSNTADDLSFGSAGLLLGTTQLKRLVSDPAMKVELKALGDRIADLLRAAIDGKPCGPRHLGFAHGAAGTTFALLRWNLVSHRTEPWLQGELEQLEAAGVRMGDAMYWPKINAENGSPATRPWAGWCHGSTGHVLLWLEAHDNYRDDHYLELACCAGEHVWATRREMPGSLCCGLSGAAIAMLRLQRASRLSFWRERAVELAEAAARSPRGPEPNLGLFTGIAGVALAAAEVLHGPVWPSWPVCDPLF